MISCDSSNLSTLMFGVMFWVVVVVIVGVFINTKYRRERENRDRERICITEREETSGSSGLP